MQLEFEKVRECKTVEEAFQSHIGAIRIRAQEKTCQTQYLFQSHIGAIRMRLEHIFQPRLINFNPTLVQLEYFGRQRMPTLLTHFNPTLVQLE